MDSVPEGVAGGQFLIAQGKFIIAREQLLIAWGKFLIAWEQLRLARVIGRWDGMKWARAGR
jgi:hypothetical protein